MPQAWSIIYPKLFFDVPTVSMGGICYQTRTPVHTAWVESDVTDDAAPCGIYIQKM